MYDLYPNQRATAWSGSTNDNILDPGAGHQFTARQGSAMVCPEATPFPMTIYENIAFGIRLYERLPKSELDGRCSMPCNAPRCGKRLRTKLGANGLSLSGGQQQRLCIARYRRGAT